MNIDDLLPEKMSDESAYHLVTFFMNLALALESCYFAQSHRYVNDTTPCQEDFWIGNNVDDDLPF